MTSATSKKKAVLADIGLVYSAAIWGSTFFIVKAALTGIDPVIMVGYRFLFAGLAVLVYLWWRGKPVLVGLKRAAYLGLLLWLLYVPQTMGLEFTTASNSGFITGLFVAFVPFFLLTIFRRRPTIMELAASGVSLAGLWILTGGMTYVNTGDLLTLITAMMYALHLLYSDKYLKAGADPLVISCQQFMVVGLLSLLTAAIFGLPFSIRTREAGLIVLFLAIFPTLLAFVIQMLAQRIRSPLRVSLIFAFEPVFAALFAWTLGGEAFVTRRAIGGLFVFSALVISGLPMPLKNKAVATGEPESD